MQLCPGRSVLLLWWEEAKEPISFLELGRHGKRDPSNKRAGEGGRERESEGGRKKGRRGKRRGDRQVKDAHF